MKQFIIRPRGYGKNIENALAVVHTMKTQEIGQTIYLASPNNEALYVKIPICFKHVSYKITFDEVEDSEKGGSLDEYI